MRYSSLKQSSLWIRKKMSTAEGVVLVSDHFRKEMTKKEEERYWVGLPWIDDRYDIL